MTYEVVKHEFRNNQVKKEFNLFDTKRQAHKYLQDCIKTEHSRTVGSVKDGKVSVFDTDGVMRCRYEVNSF